MADTPLFRFQIGVSRGFAHVLYSDRVGLSMTVTSGPTVSHGMSATEARSLANALYEAADASEKVLPVETAASQEAA